MAHSSGSGTSVRKHIRDHDIIPSSNRYIDGEWETKEALLRRELEEARSRAAQMEKTMRWWSDCTANWREKWSKVRTERNHAREEIKALRSKLEFAIKDTNTLKYEYQELESQNEHLKKEIDKIHTILLKYAGQFEQQIITILESDPELKNAFGINELLKMYSNVTSNEPRSISPKETFQITNPRNDDCIPNRDIEEYVLKGAVPKHAVELYKETLDRSNADESLNDSSYDDVFQNYLPKSDIVQDKKNKENDDSICDTKQEDLSLLEHTADMLRAEITQLQDECSELQKYKAEAMKEVMHLKSEARNSREDLDDEADDRDHMDRRLSELCAELEKLQTENAAEWGKRERLESEKIALERENKLLKSELEDLRDRVETRKARPTSSCDSDKRVMQQDFLDCNKELIDLKQSHAKLKKVLAEKTTELSHAVRRSEQYEIEVKKVRLRVDELKKDLALAQDEVDTVTSSLRKLQRVNEDLVEQLESANLQLERLKDSSETCTPDVVAETMDEKCCEDNENDTELL